MPCLGWCARAMPSKWRADQTDIHLPWLITRLDHPKFGQLKPEDAAEGWRPIRINSVQQLLRSLPYRGSAKMHCCETRLCRGPHWIRRSTNQKKARGNPPELEFWHG